MGLLCASVARCHKTREKMAWIILWSSSKEDWWCAYILSVCFYDDGTFSTRHIFHENDITLSQPPHTLLDHHLKWDLMKGATCAKKAT